MGSHNSSASARLLEDRAAKFSFWKLTKKWAKLLAWTFEKSNALVLVARHNAEKTTLVATAVKQDELDCAAGSIQQFSPSSVAELLEKFDRNVAAAVALLKNQTDERMQEKWRLRSGEQVFFELPRVAVVRTMTLNHIVHHRGQLSVYLRLLDVPLPSIYGPTADEALMP